MFTKMLLGQEKAGLKKQQRSEPRFTSPQTKEGRVTCKERLSLKHLKKLLYPVMSGWSIVWSLHSEPPFYLCFAQSRAKMSVHHLPDSHLSSGRSRTQGRAAASWRWDRHPPTLLALKDSCPNVTERLFWPTCTNYSKCLKFCPRE